MICMNGFVALAVKTSIVVFERRLGALALGRTRTLLLSINHRCCENKAQALSPVHLSINPSCPSRRCNASLLIITKPGRLRCCETIMVDSHAILVHPLILNYGTSLLYAFV